jgi:hypoxanthine phosphoribosyltransferase
MASYEGTSSTNEVKQLIEPRFDWSFCCYYEDIVDTGNTLVELKELFKSAKTF